MTVDLEALRRTEPQSTSGTAGGGGFGKKLVLGIVVLGALGWAFLLARPLFFPPRRVNTMPVRVETGASSVATLVEATGWLEPDPFPTVVRPLVDGIVESLDVLEGAEVKAGKTVIARLSSAERRAALERAEAAVLRVEKSHAEAEAGLKVAETLLAQKLDLRREVVRLEGEAAHAKAEIQAAEAEAEAADRAADAARADVAAQEELSRRGGVVPIQLAKAKAALSAAEASAAAKRAAGLRARAAFDRAKAEGALAAEALEAPRALEGEVVRARARVASVHAEQAEAVAVRDVAAREVAWLTVLAPVDGVVLRREAMPGLLVGPGVMPVGGQDAGPEMAVGGVVTLYDPKHLQARIDVPLASVAGVGLGRKAEVTIEALQGRTFKGEVTRVEGRADPLKNTLQVKVRIEDPDPVMRPEMLARARFLAAPAPAAAGAAAPTAARVLVPKRALKGDVVYVVDPRGGGRARAVKVQKVAEEGDWVEVRGDVSATHRAILDEVEDGERVEGGGS